LQPSTFFSIPAVVTKSLFFFLDKIPPKTNDPLSRERRALGILPSSEPELLQAPQRITRSRSRHSSSSSRSTPYPRTPDEHEEGLLAAITGTHDPDDLATALSSRLQISVQSPDDSAEITRARSTPDDSDTKGHTQFKDRSTPDDSDNRNHTQIYTSLTPDDSDDESTMSTIRIPKPDFFYGKATTMMEINTWIHTMKEYLELCEVAQARQSKIAAIYLRGTAQDWYMDNFRDKSLPLLDEFLEMLKNKFTPPGHIRECRHKLENFRQNKTHSVIEHTAEFRAILAELKGRPGYLETDEGIVERYIESLRPDLRLGIQMSRTTAYANLDEAYAAAQFIYQSIEQQRVVDNLRRTQSRQETSSEYYRAPWNIARRNYRSNTSTVSNATPNPTNPTNPTNRTQRLAKITDEEKRILKENDGCFACRQPNAGHMSRNCPHYPRGGTVRGESVNYMESEVVDQFESSSPYSRSSEPPLATTVQMGKAECEALIDTGASANVMSQNFAERAQLKVHDAPHPVQISQVQPGAKILTKQAVTTPVEIPKKNWHSKYPHQFYVTDQTKQDAILAMPFLKQEEIVIDAAHRHIILPDHDDSDADTDSDSPTKLELAEPSIDPQLTVPDPQEWQPSIAPERAQELHDQLVKEYPTVFADGLPIDKLPHPDAPRHRIILKDPDKAINGRLFKLPSRYLHHLKDFIDENLKAGRIRPSCSNMTAGTWMVLKKDPDARPRVVHDYRALNDNTVKDYTPLPDQDEVIRACARAKLRGKIDFPSAYSQIWMDINDISKTAFKTPFGLYEWLVMPQGLCNAVGTFQRYMNWLLRDHIGRFCYVYLDDITYWADAEEELLERARAILDIFKDVGLIASSTKSILVADEIGFLGHIISTRGIEVEPAKVDAIQQFPRPKNPGDIRSFNGLVNYIAQFIPDLARWSSILSDLTKKNTPFKWTAEHQVAFDTIKQLAASTPILQPLDYSSPEPIMLVADASDNAIGGYIGQGLDHLSLRPAGFHSRSLNSHERNYPTHDKEMLAIIDTEEKFKPQLLGTRFEILTDHAPLVHFNSQKNLNARQIRWNEKHAQYDASIRYIPGIKNVVADALSRYPPPESEPDDATELEELEICALSVLEYDPKILLKVKDHYKDDSFFKAIIQAPEEYPIYQFDEGLLFFEGRLCIPNHRETRESLLKQYHDANSHFGFRKTYANISTDYFWPNLHTDVKKYIQSCVSCATNKSTNQRPAGLLHPMPIPAERFSEIAMDFVGPIPKCKGFDMILVMTDRLTNYIKIEPTTQHATAPDIAELVYRSWYRQFGLPKAITSDRDKLFTSRFWKELARRIGIELRMSTSYHPQTDGATERANKTVIEALRHYVNRRQTDWVDHLIHVEASFNNSVNATTAKTPTEMLYGTTLRLFPTPIPEPSRVPAVEDYIENIQESIKIAKDGHVAAKTHQTTRANKRRRPDPALNVGDKVYVDTHQIRTNIKRKGRSAKFYPRYIGPFEIIQTKPTTSTYKLSLPSEYKKLHPVFHISRLRLSVPNDPELFPGREPPRPPPVVEGTEVYEIEHIVDHKDTRQGRRYLVHWLGYPDSDDEWIHEGEMGDAQEVVDDYLKRLEMEMEMEMG
jgi:hypothetical protein